MMNQFRVLILLIHFRGIKLKSKLRKPAKILIVLNQVKKYRRSNIEIMKFRYYQAPGKNQQITNNS